MEFGYFTLSDNRYPDNPRTPEQLMRDIVAEAAHADRVGLGSVWIGEHHFNRRGCIPTPSLLLANIAAVAPRVRLAPAVVALPLHHPIHVAEEWATLDQISGGRVEFAMGRGYDSFEYAAFGADFQLSAEMFEEGVDLLWRCWTEPEAFSHAGRFYSAQNIEVIPKPAQKPFTPTIACFSRYSMDIAAKRRWNIIFAPFAAGMVFGSLANAVAAYRSACAAAGTTPGKAKCSYFIHIADTPAETEYGRDCLIRYFTFSGMRPPRSADTGKLPPSMQYYADIYKKLSVLQKEDLDEGSILLGSPQQIVDALKRVEEAGIEEVILYFNHGLKPHATVLKQMDRFMAEIAPAFARRPALQPAK
jgi:alkanesulfonate monooxygenase SsuD/methylene tetrahydromethanopterin reductase-like flavin-dependent oxidoreductase (luciferase family)